MTNLFAFFFPSSVSKLFATRKKISQLIPHKCVTPYPVQDGTIGSELVIRPLPERVLQEVVSKAPALHEPELLPNISRSDELRRTSHHIVFKKVDRPTTGDEYSDFCKYAA